MGDRALAVILNRLRRRLLWITSVAGGLWALSAAALCVLVGIWLDLVLELSSLLRIASLFVAGLIAVVLFAALCRLAFQQGVFTALARRLDIVAGTKGEILSGVELADPSTQSSVGLEPELTAGMAKIAVNRAALLVENVAFPMVVPARPFRRSLTASLVFAVTIVAVILIAPRLAMTQWLRFADPFGDHPPYSRVKFDVNPAGAKVYFSEGLKIRAVTEGPPVDSVSLVFQPAGASAEELPMFPETDGTWRATIANITTKTEFFVRADRARSQRYRIDVITVPNIEGVHFRITPPEYTRGNAYEGSLPQGGLAGLRGTEVRVTVRSNRPLKTGKLIYTVGETTHESALAPDISNPTIVRGEIVIDGDGRLELNVVDTDGQESREPYSTPVVLLNDERPYVRLSQPREVSFATPNAVLPVVINAEDDYGVSRLQLFRNLNDSRYLPMDVAVAAPPASRLAQVVQLPLAAYGLNPGDEIKLFARVEDNDPAVSPAGKGAESSIVTIRIISSDTFQQLQRSRDGMKLLLSKYQQASRRLEGLVDEIKQLRDELKQQPPDSPLTEEIRKKLQQLTERMREETTAFEELVKQSLPYDLDRQLTPKLQELADMLRRLEKRTEALAENEEAKLQQLHDELNAMLEQLHNERDQVDRQMMKPLQLLKNAIALMADQSRFTFLYKQQRALADRLTSLKGRDHENDLALKVRMRDFEVEQQRLQGALEELIDKIEEHADGLPDNDPTYAELKQSALDFANELRNSGGVEAMSEAVAGLADFSGTDGHFAAKRAADILEKFLTQSQGMGSAAGNSLQFQPGLAQSLSTTAQQLLADAGLSPGATGGGSGGYSTSRNTLQNVGLYGGIPMLDQPSGGVGKPNNGLAGSGRSASGGIHSGGAGAVLPLGRTETASGVGEAAIPLRYRRKVGRYFQQIADEVGDQ